jgi:hypothetical protein
MQNVFLQSAKEFLYPFQHGSMFPVVWYLLASSFESSMEFYSEVSIDFIYGLS